MESAYNYGAEVDNELWAGDVGGEGALSWFVGLPTTQLTALLLPTLHASSADPLTSIHVLQFPSLSHHYPRSWYLGCPTAPFPIRSYSLISASRIPCYHGRKNVRISLQQPSAFNIESSFRV